MSSCSPLLQCFEPTTALMVSIQFTEHVACTSQMAAGWPQSRRIKIPEFSRLFHSHNYAFPEIIATKSLRQHLGQFLATVSPRMHKNGYFSWYLLDRVATLQDHNDCIYQVNSCFAQAFDHINIILFVIIFPWRCTKFPETSIGFPGSENSLSIPGLWPPWAGWLSHMQQFYIPI